MAYIICKYGSGGGGRIPDGKTVTPTDDIQIWLHCANIWDKDYSTLSEVLADSNTLLTLITSDNAVDYMVRSTTWAARSALVPKMTSDITPSGIASASSVLNTGTYAYSAFDETDTPWISAGSTYDSNYVQYIFAEGVVPSFVEWTCYVDSNTNRQELKIEGAEDGINYSDILLNVSESSYVDKKKFSYEISNTKAYRGFRAYLNVNLYNGQWFGAIRELQFYSASVTTSETAMQYIGSYDYAAETLLSDSTWLTAIDGSTYKDYVINASIPTMTSDTAPSGECSAGSTYSSTYPYNAFDKDESTLWLANKSSTLNVAQTEYIQYRFDHLVLVKKMYMLAKHTSINFTVKYTLEGSTDGNTFTTILTDNDGHIINNGYSVEISNNTNKYSYYRLTATMTGNSESTAAHPRFNELNFYGRENGGVQSWLKAGGINKSYTTLAEVLNDTTTLSALMSNNSAVDYLVTVKGWTDNICANSNAMTYIGQNNYCANTLLADEDWCSAICNSTYFESVLNVKVPAMTSNTTPSGECLGYAYVDTAYYKAFDGDDSSYIGGGSKDTPNQRYWVGYHFTSSVCVKKAYIIPETVTSTAVYKVQGSNDGTNWDDLAQYSNSLANITLVMSDNTTDYEYYRWYLASASSQFWWGANTVQFYGREDV